MGQKKMFCESFCILLISVGTCFVWLLGFGLFHLLCPFGFVLFSPERIQKVLADGFLVFSPCSPCSSYPAFFFFFFYGAVMYRDCMGVLYSRKLAGVPEFVQCCCLLFKDSRLQVLGSTFKNNIYKQKWPSSQTIGQSLLVVNTSPLKHEFVPFLSLL